MSTFKSALLILFIGLAGCSSVSEIQPVSGVSFPSGYSVGTVEVEDKTGKFYDLKDNYTVTGLMQEAMEEALEKAGKRGASSNSLTYKVAVIQYQQGSAVARWMMPGVGKTILSVEGTVVDASGAVIATSQATESIGAGGGFTAGAWKYIFGNVADKLVGDLP